MPLVGKPIGAVEDLEPLVIKHIMDWPKSELAACLFGGNEPPGRLFTKSHEFVIIDSELMFATGPCSFSSTRWWGNEHTPSPSGLRIAQEVCHDLLEISASKVKDALSVPVSIKIVERWPISPYLFASFSYAKSFCEDQRGF